jgi:hypothetical protein
LFTVTFAGQFVIVGAIPSRTVTVDTHTLVLPAASVTVRVMLLAPLSLQVKVIEAGANTKALAAVQLSVDPPLIWADVTVTEPALAKLTVMFWQTAVGF